MPNSGHIFEVTRDHEVVWEYVSPYKGREDKINMIYRAYRLPYEWVPQGTKPAEKAILKLDTSKFRVPGSPRRKAGKVTKIKGKLKKSYGAQFCVLPQEK